MSKPHWMDKLDELEDRVKELEAENLELRERLVNIIKLASRKTNNA
jgi:hypothetical protein